MRPDLSLADRILAAPADAVAACGLKDARESLALPWDFLCGDRKNHISPPHASIADILADETKGAAKPFCADAEVAAVIVAMRETPDHMTICQERARLPTPRGWLEWEFDEEPGAKFGILWRAIDERFFEAECFIFNPKLGEFPGSVVEVQSDFYSMKWRPKYPSRRGGLADIEESAGLYLEFFTAFCAFVMTPRACETRWQGPSRQVRRARARAGLAPLLSFNEIAFAPLRTSQSHARRYGENPGVRLHDVIAHWRHIIRKNGSPDLILIPAHTRGSARKGIVLKKRRIAA